MGSDSEWRTHRKTCSQSTLYISILYLLNSLVCQVVKLRQLCCVDFFRQIFFNCKSWIKFGGNPKKLISKWLVVVVLEGRWEGPQWLFLIIINYKGGGLFFLREYYTIFFNKWYVSENTGWDKNDQSSNLLGSFYVPFASFFWVPFFWICLQLEQRTPTKLSLLLYFLGSTIWFLGRGAAKVVPCVCCTSVFGFYFSNMREK